MFESDVWPTLKLCMDCRADAIGYCIEEAGVIHGNPILIELALPGDNGNRLDAIRVWRKVENQSSTYREFYIKYKYDSPLVEAYELDILNRL